MSPKAIVVGAGPAGASAALGLLRSGLSVTILEQRQRWRGRVCGAFLSPEAVAHLHSLGLGASLRAAAPAPVLEALVFLPRQKPRRVSTRQGEHPAWALDRKSLEENLLAQVQKQGGQVHWGTRVLSHQRAGKRWRLTGQHLPEKGVPSAPEEFEADLLILADGRFSQEKHTLSPLGWYGWNAAFAGVNQQPGELSLYLAPGHYAGVITFANGLSNVAGLIRRSRGGHHRQGLGAAAFEDLSRRHPAFGALLEKAQRQDDWQGVGPLPFRDTLKEKNGGLPSDRPLPVGDAGAVGDPFMGEGIARALSSGPLLHQALAGLDLSRPDAAQTLDSRYREMWNRRYPARLRMAGHLRTALQHPWLFHGLLRPLLAWRTPLIKLLPLFHGAHSRSHLL